MMLIDVTYYIAACIADHILPVHSPDYIIWTLTLVVVYGHAKCHSSDIFLCSMKRRLSANFVEDDVADVYCMQWWCFYESHAQYSSPRTLLIFSVVSYVHVPLYVHVCVPYAQK